MAVYIPSFQVLRGRPRFFLPSGFQRIIIFGSRVGSIFSTWPYQISCFRVMSSNISCASILSLKCSFLYLFVNSFKKTQMALKSALVHLPARNWYRVLFKVMFKSLATCVVMCLPLFAFIKEKSWNSQQSAQNEVCFSNYHGVCWMLQQCGVPWIIGEVSVHFLIHIYDDSPLIL